MNNQEKLIEDLYQFLVMIRNDYRYSHIQVNEEVRDGFISKLFDLIERCEIE